MGTAVGVAAAVEKPLTVGALEGEEWQSKEKYSDTGSGSRGWYRGCDCCHTAESKSEDVRR